MGGPLRAIADDANAGGDVRYVAGLLATVAWFMPNGSDWTNPYGPFATFGDRRSPIPGDFTEADLAALAEIADSIPSLVLRSRVFDVLAIAGDPGLRPSRHTAQLQALADHGVTSDAMTHAGEQWDRALAVGVRFRGVAAAPFGDIERQAGRGCLNFVRWRDVGAGRANARRPRTRERACLHDRRTPRRSCRRSRVDRGSEHARGRIPVVPACRRNRGRRGCDVCNRPAPHC
ncbi:DUF7380 domain-containing protein [Demequina litorisediminis]|uniref:DUF7380 domain-containing protein n=1 Tax=Demequina litorisediminis TaxID=1849022 RepID=UPI003D67B088